SRMVAAIGAILSRMTRRGQRHAARTLAKARLTTNTRGQPGWLVWLPRVLFLLLTAALAYGAWRLIALLWDVTFQEWCGILTAGFWTLSRVLAATALGTLWALPAGLAIGLSPRLSRVFQPVVQVVASFPAPM